MCFYRYVEKLKCRKQEYPNLVSKKEEAHINLKECVNSFIQICSCNLKYLT